MNRALIPHPTAATPAKLSDHAERVRRYLDNSKSQNTKRMYKTFWREFVAHCEQHKAKSLPASVEVVAAYLTALADAGAKASTIEVKRAAIGWIHEQAGCTNPAKTPQIRETMKSIRRTIGSLQHPKAAISLEQLTQIVATLPDDIRGKRDKAMLLLAFAGAFRRSELVALKVEDVTFTRDSMRILIERSKTDQEAEGMFKHVPKLDDKADNIRIICPVTAYRDWLKAADIRSGIVFRSIDRWGHTHEQQMDGKEVARIIKRAAIGAGLDAEQFAGHSLRSGYVTEAANRGVNDADIMEQTGHKRADTLRRYKHLAGRGAKRATLAVFGQ